MKMMNSEDLLDGGNELCYGRSGIGGDAEDIDFGRQTLLLDYPDMFEMDKME